MLGLGRCGPIRPVCTLVTRSSRGNSPESGTGEQKEDQITREVRTGDVEVGQHVRARQPESRGRNYKVNSSGVQTGDIRRPVIVLPGCPWRVGEPVTVAPTSSRRRTRRGA